MIKIVINKSYKSFTYSIEQSDEFKELIKNIEGKSYNEKMRKWIIPNDEFDNFMDNISDMTTLKIQLSESSKRARYDDELVIEEEEEELLEDKQIVTIDVTGKDCVVTFKYREDIVKAIKEMEKKTYDGKNKAWIIPLRDQKKLINKLQKLDIQIETKV